MAYTLLALKPLRIAAAAATVLFVVSAVSLGATLPDDIVAPPYRLSIANDPFWRTLFHTLSSQGGIHSQFEELRFLPIRKRPVVLTGEMRLSPDRGLSLHYLKPEESCVMIDSRGIVFRDATGRVHEVASDPRARGATSALLQVMRFDPNVLERDFAAYGARDGIAWQVAFEPKPEAAARDISLGRIIVRGQEDAVLLIEFRRSDRQRIEIHVGPTRTGVTFSAAELATWFRQPAGPRVAPLSTSAQTGH